MNRIFRVIWNHATQTWTAVGELASAKGKSKSVKLAAISTALLAVVAGGAQAAQEVVMKAEDRGGLAIGTSTVSAQFYGNADYKAKTGLTENKVGAKVNAYDGIAIGNGALSGSNSGTAGNAHVAIGLMSQATGNTANGKVGDGANGQNAAVALGAYSLATGQGSTAIGAHAVASDLNSTALGKIAHADGASSTAVGQQSQAVQRATATGAESKALGLYSTAMGQKSKVNSMNSIAVGSNAKVETGQNSVTVGSNTEIRGNKITSVGANSNIKSANVSTLGADITVGTGRDGAVVLGHESSADDKVIAVNSAKIGDNSKLTYTGFAGNLGGTNNKGKNTAAAKDKQGNFVSVGSEDNERQIKHVAAGRITEDSTDALNGSQLYQVAKTLGNAAEGLADTLGVGLNEDGTVTNKFSQPLTVAEGSDYTAPADAGDVKTALTNLNNYVNAGWNVTASGNDYKNNVSVGHTVNFVGLGNVDVDGVNEENGVRTINISSDSPIDYATTKAEVDGNEVDVVKANDGKWYPKDKVDENNNPKEGAAPIPSSEILKKDAKLTDSDTENNPYEKGNSYTYDDKGNITATGYDKTKPESKDEITAGKNGVQLNNVGWATQPDQAVNKDQLDQTVNKSGFYVQQNGKSTLDAKTDSDKVSDTEKVTPNDVVNFVNGNGTVIKAVTTRDANGVDTTNVTFNVDMAEITPDSDGSVNGPVPQNLLDALDKAQEEVEKNPNDEGAKKALEAAQDAVNKAGGNKVANAQNVADMINSSGFTLKTSATADGKKESGDDEIINPGKTVEMIAGKNLTVKQEANGKVTYSMKDDVEFTSVKVGEDKDGKKPVNFTTEKATDASNNDPANKPTTALNVSSSDGKPTQITGVGSVLDTADVNTSTGDQRDANGNVTTPAKEAKDKLVNLGTNLKKGDKPLSEETLNSAATVRDLANMGWVVSAKDNNYTNTVKNANKVEFKGDKGISVTGKDVTQKDGTVTREITVAIADGKVTDKVTITKDGKDIPAIKIGDNYYEVDKNGKPVGYEVDEKGKPTANNKPIDVAGATITNEGNKVVTGNTVATAIQESGWNVGLADASKANAAFSDKDKALSADKLEKVNPNDNVRFADGKGTKAVVATVERVNEFGKKITDTYVKFDVDAGKVEATKDAAGNNTGAVTGPVTAALNDALMKAQDAQKALKPDATEAEKDAAQAAVDAAQAAVNNAGNQVTTAQNVAEAINNSGWRTNSKTATGGAKDTLINPGKAVNFESGKNMEVAQTVDKDGNVAYTYATKDDVQFNSVQLGDNGPKLTNNGNDLKVSGSNGTDPVKITNIADGNISANSKDAVNGSQLHATNVQVNKNAQNINRVEGKVDNLSQVINNHAGEFNRLDRKVNKYGKEARAGIAGANAAAGLPQVYIPGKSMVAASAGTYKGQSALAVGYSRASDNGQLILKLQGNANTRGDVGGSVGVGYQW